MIQHPRNRTGIEKVCTVFHYEAMPIAAPLDDHGQIEMGNRLFRHHVMHREAVQIQAAIRRIPVSEHDLKQRRMAQIALGLQGFHQFLKRQILMPESAKDGLPHPSDQFEKTRVTGKIAAQRQHIDEQADHTLGFLYPTIGDRRAHHDVFLTRVAIQQYLEGGQQKHEKGRALPFPQGQQRCAECLIQRP